MAMTFELVVRSAAGAIQTLAVSAADPADARSRAVRDGFHVLACAPRASMSTRHARNAAQARRGLDITTFSYELASLLSAGLSVLEALRTLAAKERVAARRAMVLDLLHDVGDGLPLSGALGKHPGRYPPLMVATVSASEQTGDLSVSLRRYAEHIVGMHIHDTRVGRDHLAPGQGNTDFAMLGRYLRPETVRTLELSRVVTAAEISQALDLLEPLEVFGVREGIMVSL